MVSSAVAGGLPILPDTLGFSPPQEEAVAAFGRLVAGRAVDALGMAFGLTVRLGPLTATRIEAAEVQSANWDGYHTFEVAVESGDATHRSWLLLPKDQVPALLPAFSGITDLAELETAERLVKELAEHLSGELQQAATTPLTVTVLGIGTTPHGDAAFLRLDHTLTSEGAGGETALDLIHLLPMTTLAALAGPGGGETLWEVPSEAAPEPPAPP
ncbi:MAG: hypothetical protein ACRDJN_17995, partial [Chloroflexota bacterium]